MMLFGKTENNEVTAEKSPNIFKRANRGHQIGESIRTKSGEIICISENVLLST